MRPERAIARLVTTLGLLVLGAVALARLPLEYLPRQSFPELTVSLGLTEASDPAEVTRAWVEEIESAIRSLGRVEAVAGEVTASGAQLTVRFAPGTDPDRKAARLESELAALRARVPGSLWITPSSEAEGDFFAIVWMEGPWLGGTADERLAEAAAEELRSIPGVREVQIFGTARDEVRVELRPGLLDPLGAAAALRSEVRQALRAPALGRSQHGGRWLPVIVEPLPDGQLSSLSLPRDGGVLPLGAVASVRSRAQEPPVRVRYRGAPARALFVWRAESAPLLTVDRALRRRLEALPDGLRGTVGWSDAEPLRQLVRRLALAGLLASALAAAVGARLGGRWGALALGLALPAAVAASANAFWLAGVTLNVTTLVAISLGTTAILPAALLRVVRRGSFAALAATTIAAAAVVPITVALASAELGPVLTEPARGLLLAAAVSVLAAGLLPSPSGSPRAFLVRRGGNRLKAAFRDPGTVVLAAMTLAYLAVTLFGSSLIPEPADLEPDAGSLSLRLRLPRGTPQAEVERRVREAEEKLTAAEEVESFWSRSQEGMGMLVADVRPRDRRPDRLARLVTRLRYEVGGGALDIRSGLRGSSGRGGSLREIEDRAETDEESTRYRVVLRSADLSTLQAGYDRLLGRLADQKVRSHWITGWEKPALSFSLRPTLATPPGEAAALAALLREASAAPARLPLPRATGRERELVVVPAGAPEEPERRVPQIAALLHTPLPRPGGAVVPASALTLREEAGRPRIARQSGRFVVPIDMVFPQSNQEYRRERIEKLDLNLAQLRLPTGCDLERPSLAPRLWQRERTRLMVLALAVPLLLFAVAACRLGSISRGLIALVPPGIGLLAATPVVYSALGQIDELTIFALAASLALALPAIVEGFLDLPGGSARLYRAVRRRAPWVLGAVPVLVAGLWIPTLGLSPVELRWVTPLRAAAVSGGAGLLSAALLAPALLLLSRGAIERWRAPEEVRRRRQPPVWSEPGIPALEAHNVVKVYRGGVPALAGVRFELRPGIVGLLGPNGAGKTTLLRILTGLLDPTRGEVLFRGVAVTPENLAEYRRQIGFLPQAFNAYPEFTAEQFLDHWALERGGDLRDSRRRAMEIERLLAAVGLAEHAGRKVRDFSGGMRQRVGIARALLGSPPILIVDEPTTGLDVESRTRFRQTLLEQAAERIVLFSTHIASDIEAAASRILLLHRGQLRFDGTPEELAERARGRVFRALVSDAELAEFSALYRITARVRTLEGIRVRAVARAGQAIGGEPVEPNLEEAYLAEVDLAETQTERFRFLR